MGSASDGDGAAASRMADVLGWSSLGLGLPMLAAPNAFGRAIGIAPTPTTRLVTLAVGAQELLAAGGILAIERPRPLATVWSRVAGDALHAALLARALGDRPASPGRLLGALGAVAAIGAADVATALALTRRRGAAPEEDLALHARAAITINRPRDRVYAHFRQFERLPEFMDHLQAVEAHPDGRRSEWTARAPAGTMVSWEAEIVEEVPGELIAWRSVEGAAVRTTGSVRFVDAPGGRGTELHVDLRYDAPGGAVGSALAKLFGEQPRQQLKDDLRRLKQVLETGEVVRSDGAPEGQTARRYVKQRPAQPLPAERASA